MGKGTRLRLAFLTVMLGMAAAAAAQETTEGAPLILYVPPGPSPAIAEAATAFSQRHHVHIELRTGPVEAWLGQAARDADLVYCGCGSTLASLLACAPLQLRPESARSLYSRPSLLLVRPGNPKQIRSFSDLLEPGVRILVGETAAPETFWRELRGALAEPAIERGLRQNAAHFAASSDAALRAWQEHPEFDAWIAWNTWYLPPRDRAQLVPLGKEYRIHRDCGVALTARGLGKPMAARFAEYLASPEGAAIFASWGWLTTVPTARFGAPAPRYVHPRL